MCLSVFSPTPHTIDSLDKACCLSFQHETYPSPAFQWKFVLKQFLPPPLSPLLHSIAPWQVPPARISVGNLSPCSLLHHCSPGTAKVAVVSCQITSQLKDSSSAGISPRFMNVFSSEKQVFEQLVVGVNWRTLRETHKKVWQWRWGS